MRLRARGPSGRAENTGRRQATGGSCRARVRVGALASRSRQSQPRRRIRRTCARRNASPHRTLDHTTLWNNNDHAPHRPRRCVTITVYVIPPPRDRAEPPATGPDREAARPHARLQWNAAILTTADSGTHIRIGIERLQNQHKVS